MCVCVFVCAKGQAFTSVAVSLLILLTPGAFVSPRPTGVQEAFATLSEACDDTAVLQALITKRPQLGSVGKNILTRFLASVDGFNYLADSDWISVQVWLVFVVV